MPYPQVLHKVNMSKNFGQYGTANYNFYTSIKEGYVFLVMVESDVSASLFSTKLELPSSIWCKFKKISSTKFLMAGEGMQSLIV